MSAKYPIKLCWVVLLFILVTSSCNIYKQIPENSSVLVKNQVNVLGQEKDLINDFFYKDDLYQIPIQKPNKKVFGIPLSQHIWAFYNKKKVTQFTQFMKTKVGSAPILFDSSKLENSRIAFENYYFNIGHFDNKSSVDYITKNKKTTIIYNVHPNKPYRIRKIIYDTITAIQKDIAKETLNSYLLEGDIFNISNFINEIERIAGIAHEKGYYTFNKDYVRFNYDTFKKSNELDVYVKILEESDSSEFRKFYLDSVYIIFNENNAAQIRSKDSNIVTRVGRIQFLQNNPKNYNERFFTRFFQRNYDSFYSKSDVTYSVQRLSELNNFKIINSQVIVKDPQNRVMDLYYSLSPFPSKTISFGQYVYNSTLGFIGAQPTLSFMNRNLTKNADKLNISLSGSVEFNAYLNQNKNYSGLISRTDISLMTTYNIEKFLIPFIDFNRYKYIYNRTGLNGQYAYSKRLGFYDIHNINFTFGYEWSKKRGNTFSLSPVMFNYIIFPEKSISEEFKQTLAQNPYLRSSFNNTFILGSAFQFAHINALGRKKTSIFSYKINLETAGNTAFLIDRIIPLSRSQDNLNINGVDVSQYFKTQLEFAISKKINRNSSIHGRIKTGAAFPYGNSTQLPYIKNFFIGGPYSIRAFQPRTIGAGSFNPGQYDTDTSKFPRDQLGNIIIEMNAEYRFNIVKIFKGALFLDAGNIWSSSENLAQDEKSVFKATEFYKQFYVGGGVGLRLDANYFVLRLDLGIPFRVPYLDKNDWVIQDAKPFNGEWLSNNVLLNFAVGYPF